MVGGGIQPVDLIEAGAGGHIDLAADDGADALLFALLVEIDDAVHDTVIGDGDGGLAQGLGALDQPLDAAGAIEEAVFAVDVQMDKIGHGVPPWRKLGKARGPRPRHAGRRPARRQNERRGRRPAGGTPREGRPVKRREAPFRRGRGGRVSSFCSKRSWRCRYPAPGYHGVRAGCGRCSKNPPPPR